MALPLALAGQDVIGQARTGTGKTYAFGVAMLQLVGKPRKNRKKPRGLVLVPTRELALQVTEDLVLAAGKLGSRILTVYGGRAYEPQIEALKNGVDVIVGTPGRLLDLVKQKHLDLGQITMLVLDEADRMLDLGFLPDIERIIKLVPEERQTMLFSATMPGEIVNLSRRYLTRPTRVRAESGTADAETTALTTQHVYRTHRMDKIEIVARLMQSKGAGLTMVFCETKRACDMVAEQLKDKGFAVAAVHGDLGQGQREQALRAFRNGKISVLVATDVAARGIDIDDVTHVVNYDCPQDEKTYVHRIGRTGRAGRTGVAVTFVEWTELARWKVINNALSLDFSEPVETYSSSPHLYADLDIPEGTKGVLPRAQRSRAGLEAEEIEDLGETGRTRTRGKSGRGEREERREERRERPARTRERRRTRGGRVDAEAPSEQTEAPAPPESSVEAPVKAPVKAPVEAPVKAPVETPAEVAVDVTVETAVETAVETVPGRRGRRGANAAALTGALADAGGPVRPGKDGPADGAADGAVHAPADDADKHAEAGDGPEPETATTRRTTRRRTRAADPAPAVEAQVEERPARRRRTRAADAVDAVDQALPVEEQAVEAPVSEVADEPAEWPAPQPEPDRIVPSSPFMIVFRSPDLATDDDDLAPSAASERAQQRRRPPRPRPRRTG
ncbi:DEAD/DEAH box helicase [Microbispora bryophytorum]|uniref:DEAD/DEAH box helicase n=1 Tax=Microbispora bryophytorum TaxID=1460882 RepID=UPI00371499D9